METQTGANRWHWIITHLHVAALAITTENVDSNTNPAIIEIIELLAKAGQIAAMELKAIKTKEKAGVDDARDTKQTTHSNTDER